MQDVLIGFIFVCFHHVYSTAAPLRHCVILCLCRVVCVGCTRKNRCHPSVNKFSHTVLHLTFVPVIGACLCSNRKHINYTGLTIFSVLITSVLCLSFLQGISVNQRTTFIILTLCALRSETWRPTLSYLRLPNLHRQVLYISLCLLCHAL